MTRPIIFLDANTIWHRRLAEALAEHGQVIALNPKTGLWPNTRRSNTGNLTETDINVLHGWASTTAFVGQRLLLRHIRSEARKLDRKPLVMLTSPAYAPLAKWLAKEFPIVSYIADDYRSYEGWGGDAVIQRERQVHEFSDLSVFVSESLRNRAVAEFGLDFAKTFVSPNATERRFSERDPQARVPELEGRPGPVIGIIGALTERLDCEVLSEVASSPKVRTFLVAGPAAKEVLEKYPVFRSENCVITGFLDHSRMHVYAQALDLALIPYAACDLNHHCSPMRLWDHLATGVPILALKGCDQIDRATYPGLEVATREVFLDRTEQLIDSGLDSGRIPQPEYFWDFRSAELRKVLETLSCQETDSLATSESRPI